MSLYFLSKFIAYINYFICSIFSFIYDLIFSKPVTGFTYHKLLDRLKCNNDFENLTSILDVGIGTGTALNYVISEIPKDVKIMGVDIDEHYVTTCQKLFEKRPNVTIELKDFYDLESSNEAKFDAILFTSSFMLLPDRNKALQVAKKLLKPNGKVYFILTLFEKRKTLIEKFKPLLKYVLTVDFGQALTETQFLEILAQNDVDVIFKERVVRKYFPCFKVFRYFLVEGEFKKNEILN